MFFGVLRLVEGLLVREGMIRGLPKAAYHSNPKPAAAFFNLSILTKVFKKVGRRAAMIWLCLSYP